MDHGFGDGEESQQNADGGDGDPGQQAFSRTGCTGRRKHFGSRFLSFASHPTMSLTGENDPLRGVLLQMWRCEAVRLPCMGCAIRTYKSDGGLRLTEFGCVCWLLRGRVRMERD